MPIPFFEKIPLLGYDVDKSGEKRLIVNILQRVKMRDVLKENFLIFYEYDVKDGETPEILSAKVYGTPLYHWIILMANDIVDPYYDWVRSYEDMILTIRKRYTTTERDGVEVAHQTIHHYEDLHGIIIDEESYKQLPEAERKKVTLYEWEMAENEKKRRIQILDAKYITQIDQEVDKLMSRELR